MRFRNLVVSTTGADATLLYPPRTGGFRGGYVPTLPPSTLSAGAPARRPLFLKVVAWIAIGVGALGLPISILALLMVVAGGEGSSTSDPFGALIVFGGPAALVVSGIGLLRRAKWAYGFSVALLVVVLGANLVALARPARGPRTYVSASGVPTTVLASPATTLLPLMLIAGAAGLLVKFCSRGTRSEFGFGRPVTPPLLPTPGVNSTRPITSPAVGSTRALPPVMAEPANGPRAVEASRRAVLITILSLVAMAAGAGWLVARGVAQERISLPVKFSSNHLVTRAEKPALFWTSVALYGAFGLGALGGAAWIARAAMRDRAR